MSNDTNTDTQVEETKEEAPATPMVDYTNEEGTVAISVPKRIASQEVLANLAEGYDDEEFALLCAVLKDRRWSDHEFETRVKILRPDHKVFAAKA